MSQLLHKLLPRSCNALKKTNSTRTFSLTKCMKENYEGDGKTTVTILNREYKHLIMFDSYSDRGFRLNNGIFVMGPVAAFPRTVLQWNVSSVESLTPASLSLFAVLEPKIDILILGTGSVKMQPNPNVLSFLKDLKISTEILQTEQACATFNFLNAEGRCVAGAFLPPKDIILFEDDVKIAIGSPATSPFPVANPKDYI